MAGEGKGFKLLGTKLYDAALKGDVLLLLNVLQEDPLIVERCSIQKTASFTQSPLHVAANLGHLEFTKEILRRRPELAAELDHLQRSSPLHMASSKGHLEIVKALIAVKPDMCLARDQDGRNPLHVAAIGGQVHVLQELLQAKPQAARERTNGDETVLHLCIKYNQPEALQFLIYATDGDELLNAKGSNDNTVLHLAVAAKQTETVRFLLKNKKMEKNAINKNRWSARDIYSESRKNPGNKEIRRSLKLAQVLHAKDVLKPQNHRVWLKKQRNALMVVASLIATMAFQVGVNPPGGVWQDDSDGHIAGSSITADTFRQEYDRLLISNTVALVSSLSVILLLISGIPSKRVFVVILMATMWISVTATTLTYFFSIAYFMPGTKADFTTLGASLIGWGLLMSLLILGHVIRLIVIIITRLESLVHKMHNYFSTKDTTTHPSVFMVQTHPSV